MAITHHRQVRLARWQGAFNVIGGLWPLLSNRSFEAIYGPKTDRWLEYTVGGLLTTVGLAQVSASRSADPAALSQARILGVGAAATLLAIDLVYVPRGRIRWTYLQDAACEIGWLAAWWAVSGRRRSAPR